jgi:hypothetical protein
VAWRVPLIDQELLTLLQHWYLAGFLLLNL